MCRAQGELPNSVRPSPGRVGPQGIRSEFRDRACKRDGVLRRSRAMRILTALTFSSLALLLPSCGGGGSNPGTGGGGGTPPGNQMTAAEQQAAMECLAAINAHRQANGLTPYVWYQNGANVAYQHCVAMETQDFFAHVNPNTGTSPGQRAAEAGITHDPQGSIDPTTGHPFVGENLSAGTSQTGQQATDGWITSPGHHAQLIAPLLAPGASQTMPPWTHCGIGVRIGAQIDDGPITGFIVNAYTAVFFRNPSP